MSKHLNRVSRAIKSYLSQHFSKSNLKIISFVISLIACLSSGSIMLFSLFSTSLHELIGLTYLQINFIASLSAIGMYLCLPVLGYLADCYGPSLLSFLSIWFFCPSYFLNSWLVVSLESRELSQIYVFLFSFSFCLIGLATSSLYFLSLLTCAKIYPKHKGMSISLPITCYGISSLLGAQSLKLEYFKKGDYLNLYKVFTFFGILYFIMGVLNFISASLVSLEQEIIFEVDEEESPLLRTDSNPERPLEPMQHNQRYRLFLRDKSAYLLLFSLILNLGPLESFQNNLGSIIKITTTDTMLSNQVSVIAASSTVSRIAFGALSDYLASSSRKRPISRVWLFLILILAGSIGQAANIYGLDFTYISILSGISYGGIFTICPAIVASVWGIDIMGSTWGSFMVAPAIGSISYSLTYGKQVDEKCGTSRNCLEQYFTLTSTSLTISLILLAVVWRFFWVKRGFKVL